MFPADSTRRQRRYLSLFKILKPYFWPRGCTNKLLAMSTYACMAASQVGEEYE
jgi:hypothetical protein